MKFAMTYRRLNKNWLTHFACQKIELNYIIEYAKRQRGTCACDECSLEAEPVTRTLSECHLKAVCGKINKIGAVAISAILSFIYISRREARNFSCQKHYDRQ